MGKVELMLLPFFGDRNTGPQSPERGHVLRHVGKVLQIGDGHPLSHLPEDC